MSQSHAFHNSPVRNSRCPRNVFTPLILAIAGFWIAAMAIGLLRATDTSRFVPVFALLSASAFVIAYSAWSTDATWDDWGRRGIWFVFGLTLSLWMIGVMSIGWLLFPSLIVFFVALITWPRTEDNPIATYEGIVTEMLGFFSGPVLVVVTLSIFGF